MQSSDPIVRNVQIAPGVVLGCNFVILMVAMLSFGQAVRMYIHAVRYFLSAQVLGALSILIAVSESTCMCTQCLMMLQPTRNHACASILT